MAQDTQYWSFRYILGTVYSGKTEASEISPAHHVSLLSLVVTFNSVSKERVARGGGDRETYG